MYNFFERIKSPLNDYLKHNPHKNEQGVNIEKVINGYKGYNLRKSQSIPTTLNQSFSDIPIFNNNNSTTTRDRTATTVINNHNPNHDKSILNIRNKQINIIPIPNKVVSDDCNSPGGSSATVIITSPNEIQHILPHTETLKLLLDKSSQLQNEMQIVMSQMKQIHLDLSNSSSAASSTTAIVSPSLFKQHAEPQQNLQCFEEHIVPNSKLSNDHHHSQPPQIKSFYNSSDSDSDKSDDGTSMSVPTIIEINGPTTNNNSSDGGPNINELPIIKSKSILDIDMVNIINEQDDSGCEEASYDGSGSGGGISLSTSGINSSSISANSSLGRSSFSNILPRNDSTSSLRMMIPKFKINKEKMERFKRGVSQFFYPDTSVPIHVVDKEQTDQKVVPFIMELGRALLMSGVPAHRLEFQLTLISSTFGLDGHFFTTPTGIFFSFGSPHSILSPYTHFLRINSTDYNMNRMIKLEELADQVIYGKMNCLDALDALKAILALPPLYSVYLLIVSHIAFAFSFAFLFNGGGVEIAGCSLIGLYVGLIYWLSSKFQTIGRISDSLSAFGGAFIASMFNAFVYPVPIFLVTLGGIIALAPGLSLTLAISELSTRNLISGTSRMVNVFACLLQLVFGIALGTSLCELILPLRTEIPPNSFPSWVVILVIPIAAVSFGIQLNVHYKQYIIIILASLFGIVSGNFGSEYFGGIGAFFGSFAICALGNLYSRFSNISPAVPIMVGIILLVPGSMGIKGLLSVSSGNMGSGIDLVGSSFLIAMSLCTGLLIANLLIKPSKQM